LAQILNSARFCQSKDVENNAFIKYFSKFEQE
jgi:hypothetical protein